jgi:GH25 family lysozyme M1 (1,4-beta-N-acetylmuramidase)
VTLLVSLLAAGAVLASSPGPASAAKPPRGIDVSRFQGAIKWKRAATKGKVKFAFVQASRGSGHDCAVAPDRCGADEYYLRNWGRAHAHAVRVGPYHRMFANGDTLFEITGDATAEADLFISQVNAAGGLEPGDLRPALDVETPFGGLSAAQLQHWIRTWVQRVEAALGARPVIYTNASSWQATANTIEFADAGHPLWVAHWGVASPSVPASFWGGNGWSVWQYTSSGRVKGIKGRVDLNRLGAAGLAPITVS